MANVILIWDNNKSVVERLSSRLGISYPVDAFFSFEELKQNKLVSAKDAAIVLLDTNLDGKKRTEYFGLETVNYLRKELRYKGLIVVYSLLSEKQIREKVNKSEILFTSGIRLKQLKKEEDVNVNELDYLIQSVPKLSEDLLDDIRYNVFDTKGKIHELLHNLKNKLTDIKGKKILNDFIIETYNVFEEYKNLLLKEIDPFKIVEFKRVYTVLVKETVKDITNHWNNEKDKSSFSYANAGNQINKHSNQIVELAPVSSDDADDQKSEIIKWQVLFFDDTEGVRKKVQAFFEEKNVTCHLAATEDEVYKELKKNSPKISLFISDIRLLDNSEHWCDRQGYDVIEQVNKTNDYPLVYAVLTSKKGTINKMVQKKRRYEILWFTKDDVINNIHSFNIFFDQIKKYADENFKANSDFKIKNETWLTPTVRGAKKEIFYRFALKDYYKVHYESGDHDDAESEINLMTKQILNGTIENSIQWNCKLTSKTIDQYELNKFRKNILLGRRLILAYIFSEKNIDTQKIYLKAYKKTEYIKSTAKTYLSNICLPNRFDTLLFDRIMEYHYSVDNDRKTIPLIQEEYEFIRNEFLDIAASGEYELNETELNLLKHLFNILSAIFKNKSDLDEIPLSIKKVVMLLFGKNTVLPSVQLLFDVAEDIRNNYAVVSKSKKFDINLTEFENHVLRSFLEKCELIEN